jgi:CheY-like chemotaxis protein
MVCMPKVAALVVDRLRDEFLAEANDRLNQMHAVVETAFEAGHGDGDTLIVLRRQAHNLKGTGGGFGFPAISVIAHRLEDYLIDLNELTEYQVRNTQQFVDTLHSIVRRGLNPGEAELAELFRALPMKRCFDAENIVQTKVEVLLVASSAVKRLLVERELRAYGFRMVATRTPFEAFELIVRMKPDLVLTSVVMDGLNGIDLVRALGAMTATKDMPAALLTSLETGHTDLKLLPAGVPIVRLGRHFPKDFARVVAQYQLR